MDHEIYLTEPVNDALHQELATIEQVDKPNLMRTSASIREEIEPEDRATDEDVQERIDALERRAMEIRLILDTAEIVPRPTSKSVVSMGSSVTVDDGAARQSYTIVGSVGADPARGWITSESPLGASLLGKRPGDRVTFDAPGGAQSIAIVSID
jgi:transcription elongation factor GreA